MSKIEKIEDLIVWQKAKNLSIEIYSVSNVGVFSKDFGLRDQIRRSAVSVPSNIAEGFGRGGNKEFLQFLSIAKGSLYELKTQLIIANEIGYIELELFNNLSNTIDEIGKLITGFMNYLSSSELKGIKFKRAE
jgi:four helix bundle protein